MTQLFTFQIGFWIIFFIMLAFIIIFAMKWLLLKVFYFSNMDLSQIITMRCKIPVGDIELNGKLILPKYALNEKNMPKAEFGKLPLIIVNHGWRMNIDMIILMQYVASIAIGGPYAVLAFDVRGFGKSPGKTVLGPKLFADIPKIIDYGEKLQEIDPTRMGYIGMSLGGEMTLVGAYPDRRIKALIAIAAPFNAKENFTRANRSFKDHVWLTLLRAVGVNGKQLKDEDNKIISPEFILQKNNPELNDRVMLIGSKDDHVINHSQFLKNREVLALPENQVLLFEKGDHTLFHQELSVLATVLRFFKEKL